MDPEFSHYGYFLVRDKWHWLLQGKNSAPRFVTEGFPYHGVQTVAGTFPGFCVLQIAVNIICTLMLARRWERNGNELGSIVTAMKEAARRWDV